MKLLILIYILSLSNCIKIKTLDNLYPPPQNIDIYTPKEYIPFLYIIPDTLKDSTPMVHIILDTTYIHFSFANDSATIRYGK
jgi:hypothetical protein